MARVVGTEVIRDGAAGGVNVSGCGALCVEAGAGCVCGATGCCDGGGMTVTVRGRVCPEGCCSGVCADAVQIVNNARRARRDGLNFILHIPLYDYLRRGD